MVECSDKHLATIKAWKLLHGAFLLPPQCQTHHTCKWVVLDTDLAACQICSAIHVCSCQCPLQITEDSEVCEITGYCVRSQNIVQTGFSENVTLEEEDVTYKDRVKERLNIVKEVVHQALCSSVALKCFEEEIVKCVVKLKTKANEAVMSCPRFKPLNLHEVVEKCAQCAQKKTCFVFQGDVRKRVAKKCSANVLRAMTISVMQFNLQLRDNEVQQFALGLLFLMRRGVFINNQCILPKEEILIDLLASENLLCRSMNHTSKCVTDTENRFKFIYRQVSADALRCFQTLYAE